jgi:hypothetical protein
MFFLAPNVLRVHSAELLNESKPEDEEVLLIDNNNSKL